LILVVVMFNIQNVGDYVLIIIEELIQ